MPSLPAFLPPSFPPFLRHPTSISLSSLSPRRLLPKSCTPTPPALSPSSSTDPRGFILPEQGDIVLYQGRWANEDALGLVSQIRYIPSRATHVVDVVELRRINTELFAVPRSSTRKKLEKWLDIAEVKITPAQYVPEQDAYRVVGARDGYAKVVVDEAEREIARKEYEQLKKELTTESALVGGVGFAVVWVVWGGQIGGAFGLGALGSLLYLGMLQRGVDVVGAGGIGERILGLRYFVPALPFAVLAGRGKIGKAEALAVIGGLLCYKIPLLWRIGGEVLDGLAGVKVGQGGMLGSALGMAARGITQRGEEEEKEGQGSGEVGSQVFVFAGPSGVGKSTMIQKLMEEFEGRFCYSVSHTTRERREREEDGVDYWFVGDDVFEEMVQGGRFVEYARVHGNSYGTSYETVEAVVKEGKICILDLDVQGVEAVRRKKGLDWDARFLWIAPPSIEALEERLRRRGTETEETLKRRLDTATREIAYAVTNNVFDLTIINKDFDVAYAELKNFVGKTVSSTPSQ